MSDEVERIIEENAAHFMERGPGLSYGYQTYVVARDPERGKILIGGLGGLGVGEMWCDETEADRERPGYADAPVVRSFEEELGGH